MATDPARKRDAWDKLDILMRPIGALVTAAAIALLGYFTSNALNRRQAIDTNARLYTELMSRREEAESALRKDMCVEILASFVNPEDTPLSAAVLNLEMLAYNFHESINLKPLFMELRRRVLRTLATSSDDDVAGEYRGYLKRLETVAREIGRRQMIVLEGVGAKADRMIDLTGDPAGAGLDPVTLSLDGVTTSFTIDVVEVDRETREIRFSLSIETPDPEAGRQTKVATFGVSYFDFPMIDNTRLAHGQRCALVLNHFTEESADITLVLFPGTYASLKEKPYYNEVIENVLDASARLEP